ncbi:MAG: hypothetical protein DRP00_02035 [Candidatus Aenigmatarchaeota archaeon]|nr:MAG: hypothetical protein DRP00_02035 [Candidatus Aenigmarchaeota archaeon]
MLDEERILAKIAELRGYLKKLREITPKTFDEYEESEIVRRACERLLQISIECVLDICDMIFSGLELGIPTGEEDIIERIRKERVISEKTARKLKGMRSVRNILVHRYPYVDDERIFKNLKEELKDFDTFIGEILKFLKKSKK